MEPLVSILIPAYNSEEWISDTVKSAIAQTWSRKEIIIVDDGSKDQTLSVAQRFASKEVTVVTQDNQGAAAARNHAFSICRGDFIQWLDADDLLAPDKIERQLKSLASPSDRSTLLSGAWGTFIYRQNQAEFIPTPLWCDLSPVEWLIRKFGQNLSMQTCVWLVSRELSQKAGVWDTRLLGDDDGEYFCRVALASHHIKFVPESKIYYRRGFSSSLSYIGASKRKLEAQFLALQLYVQHIRRAEDSARVCKACVAMLQEWLPAFYPERPDLVRELENLATELGGRLTLPHLSWKYAWIEKLFGWTAAKKAQMHYNLRKSSLLRVWDKTLSRFDKEPRFPGVDHSP
jgi:glycosyltransferase involved in cell wall biosynthesis